MSLHIVILAAGKGKRMHSQLPKVLHTIAGQPMLSRVVDVAKSLEPEKIHVIIGHAGELIKQSLPDLPVHWVTQAEQLGTGHAVSQAIPYITSDARVLILSADVPLIKKETLTQLIESSTRHEEKNTSLALLLAKLENPFGLGRILRDTTGKILSIIEEKDANKAQKAIKEIYSGICVIKASELASLLPLLKNKNSQKEFYLTDIIHMVATAGHDISYVHASDNIEIEGVNNRLQLHKLERSFQLRTAENLLLEGMSIADANRFDLRGEGDFGTDIFIDINVVMIGKIKIGNNCHIGPNCVLKDVTIGDNTEILANCVIENAKIADYCQIGPYARIRPGTQLSEHCKIGNFVEVKNAVFGSSSKASHLSYIGDANIGKEVNIGAGTITCNYDGANKHVTTIEDGAFIGSDTQLIAPVTIGKNATIGAGSSIRKNAPADALTLTDNKQRSIADWKRPTKNASLKNDMPG